MHVILEKIAEFAYQYGKNMPASTHRKSDDRSARTHNIIPQN